MELFSGTGRLTSAVEGVCGHLVECLPVDAWHGWDITNDVDFEAMTKKIKDVTWMHGAPPCSTFSRGRAPPLIKLRDEEHPAGFGHPRAEEANDIVKRFVMLVRLVHEAGGAWSFENPDQSLMWDLKPVKRLLEYEGVRVVYLDQCAFGGPAKKPTKVLTNSEWLEVISRRCQDAPPHRHVELRGKVVDLREGGEGKLVWRTELAAEYPSALCTAMAEAFRRFLSTQESNDYDEKDPDQTGNDIHDRPSCCGHPHGLRGVGHVPATGTSIAQTSSTSIAQASSTPSSSQEMYIRKGFWGNRLDRVVAVGPWLPPRVVQLPTVEHPGLQPRGPPWWHSPPSALLPTGEGALLPIGTLRWGYDPHLEGRHPRKPEIAKPRTASGDCETPIVQSVARRPFRPLAVASVRG